MPGLQVLVVDDEEWARSNVTALLRRDPDVAAIAECASGAAAIAAIRK
jgi:two-component system, LytTR family, response regulator